ncbi:gastric mucin-like protein [Colletotrichum truncatum]|uniref:Gastric mucin-like protein n=1 Tax=Colletotrichum truncatum TaxID=5467 RepID=A0ACC3Z9W8_COLTU|nr:gastric mucin-like protein [Colletotrichum truncatum]KAF6796033.1 gastric mucin-like protein [Colletotrichum truncatum]
MPDLAEYHGGLIAFEGPADLVSTQLRLLPTSSQIAILPSVKEFLEPEHPDALFEARHFIKRVHDAVTKRRNIALAFLKESTPKRKRLVFMNGGTPSAQTVCIRAISRNDTNGDIAKAEAIFNEIVKGGVAGLTAHPAASRRSFLDTSEDVIEDPITQAMRAADALDRETESLQPCSDIDLTIASQRPRSMSLPLYSYADRFGDAAPFYVFGEQPNDGKADEEVEVPETPRACRPPPKLAITSFDELERLAALDFDFADKSATSPPPRSPSCIGEAYGPNDKGLPATPRTPGMLEVATPRSDVFSIRSTEPVVIEKASLVRMKSSASSKTLSRSRSVGQLHRSNSRYRDTLMRKREKEKESATDKQTSKTLSSSVVELTETAERRDLNASLQETPRKELIRASRLNKSLPPPPHGSPKPKRTKANYVDRGTDAEDFVVKSPAIQPILPFSEDLVIHFKDESPDPILEYMIRAFKEGIYPVALSSSNTSIIDGDASIPQTPTLQTGELQESQFTPAKTIHEDEYDPFSYQDTDYTSKQPQPQPVSRTVATSHLPTPAQTPPPMVSELEDKFHDFNAVHSQTAIAMQNSLRSVLNIYFPPKATGFSQFNFPLLPEMDGLWRPIFRDAEAGATPKKNGHRIDQILAIGSQKGVKKTFLSSIACQLEQLGTKSSGISRAGRLDFRYLMANAMQSFTAQPLANQTQDNPFTNSYLLAILIIPHLETYFAVHSDVRFLLLDYPPDHLATVLALQKLVGVELMKVAQVIDTDAKGSLPFSHIRGSSIGRISNKSDMASSSGSLQSKGSTTIVSSSSTDGVAVSKANFLLTSKATDAEIGTFISTIWKILTSISRFYLPEDNDDDDERRSGTSSPFTMSNQRPVSPPMSPPSSSGRKIEKRSGSFRTLGRQSSTVETVVTQRVKSRRSIKKMPADGASILTADVDYESDVDLEERRLMPLFMKKAAQTHTKGNSRKALKFLGLA